MSSKKEPIYISEILGRLRITKTAYILLLLMILVISIIGGILWGFLSLVITPYNRRSNIKNWLRSEPTLIDNYDIEKGKWGNFRYDIILSSGPEITVHSLSRDVIRLYAIQEIDPGALAIINQHGDIRNDLQEIIEAVLSNMRGSYGYLDENREPCSIERMEEIGIEYRFYTDGWSQQEFMNAILDIDRAISFVNQRIEQLAENLREQA